MYVTVIEALADIEHYILHGRTLLIEACVLEYSSRFPSLIRRMKRPTESLYDWNKKSLQRRGSKV